jgi:hypothetical protein
MDPVTTPGDTRPTYSEIAAALDKYHAASAEVVRLDAWRTAAMERAEQTRQDALALINRYYAEDAPR